MKIKIIIILALLNFKILNGKELVDSNTIFKNLRCLICQGQSVADSNSDFAHTIKLVVKDKIEKGKSEKEIYEFLVEKYGDWIVYNPPLNAVNLFLWLFPYIILVAGGLIIFSLIKKRDNS
tara:strand:- start:542 stop:904 length:363 start_codon:yes stop_codon:yes gene_type:complete